MHELDRYDDAIVSIDLLMALVLILAAVMMLIQIMPAISHLDRDWRIKQYMTGVRVSDNLVQDTGSAAWEVYWNNSNYSTVTKIGLVDNNSTPRVLNKTKINALMKNYTDAGTNLSWWEFPANFTSSTQAVRDNVTRALGLTGYNFYMQLHPVGYNFDMSQTNLTNLIGANGDRASAIDRYVYIKDDSGAGVCEFLCYNNAAVHYRLNLWVW